MYLIIKKKWIIASVAVLLSLSVTAAILFSAVAETEKPAEKKYIKWVDFGVSYEAMDQALSYDIKSQKEDIKMNWIELLSFAAVKNGGKFAAKRNADIDKLAARLKKGEKMADITKDMKYYPYYYEAYSAVLSEFVGSYKIEVPDENNPEQKKTAEKYGLKVFSPIAKNYGYSDCDDFGNSRSYGFKRKHLGHDLMGSIGTPIVAVEDGTIEVMAWNRYGGWRVGIRSLDKKRYYYYAHLRKDHPFHYALKEGMTVKAGDVIGYLGMTGYSDKENVNNMTVPHLHFGMQLIFDESQKEGNNEIWIDVYNIVKLLQKNRSKVIKNEETKDYTRVYQFVE